ncbi:MAG: hypothetical protein UD103_05005 [Bacteroidales bacterium]|nr:hypothetical protein [Bacteroidales bacterium]
MIAFKDNNSKYDAEIKLCFDLIKDFLKVSNTDTEKEKRLKENILKIDCVLNNGVEEEIVNCNLQITAEYSKTLTSSDYGFELIPYDKLQSCTYSQKYSALRNIGFALIDLLFKEKGIRFTEETLKNGVEYLIDKLKELLNRK